MVAGLTSRPGVPRQRLRTDRFAVADVARDQRAQQVARARIERGCQSGCVAAHASDISRARRASDRRRPSGIGVARTLAATGSPHNRRHAHPSRHQGLRRRPRRRTGFRPGPDRDLRRNRRRQVAAGRRARLPVRRCAPTAAWCATAPSARNWSPSSTSTTRPTRAAWLREQELDDDGDGLPAAPHAARRRRLARLDQRPAGDASRNWANWPSAGRNPRPARAPGAAVARQPARAARRLRPPRSASSPRCAAPRRRWSALLRERDALSRQGDVGRTHRLARTPARRTAARIAGAGIDRRTRRRAPPPCARRRR